MDKLIKFRRSSLRKKRDQLHVKLQVIKLAKPVDWIFAQMAPLWQNKVLMALVQTFFFTWFQLSTTYALKIDSWNEVKWRLFVGGF